MPDIDKLKAQQEKVKTEIRQLENRQKILLNRKTDAERKARTRRLIEGGAVLESIFPAVTAMTGEEVKMFKKSPLQNVSGVMRYIYCGLFCGAELFRSRNTLISAPSSVILMQK